MELKFKHKIRVGVIAAAILIPVLTGLFSAFLTSEDMALYETMARPDIAPPGWIFPIVWTVLYILMGCASYIVYVSDAETETKRKALIFYALQLAMNFFWSTLFFTYSRYLISLIWLLAMWGLILIAAIRFYRIKRAAGLMMGVLFLWTTFAAYLNLACYVMSITPMPITA